MDKSIQWPLRILVWTGAAVAVCFLARRLLRWGAPLLTGAALAALAEPRIRALRRRLRWKRGYLAALYTLGLLAGAAALAATVARQLWRQAREALRWLPALPEVLAAAAERLAERLAAAGAWPEGAERFAAQASALLEGRLGELTERLSAWALQAAASAASRLPGAALFCLTAALATFFAVNARPAAERFLRRQLTERQRRLVRGAAETLRASLGKWLRAQGILLAMTFAQLLTGFALLRQPYALLLAFLIALIDALPVLGVGTVLLPWAAALLLAGQAARALALAGLWALAALVRSVMEPRVMASLSSLPPLAALAAVYVGYRAMGVAGMVLLPVGALFLKELHQAGYLRLWK